MMRAILFILLYLSAVIIKGQPAFPENGELFKDQVVPRIDITINQDTLAWLYEYDNLESNTEFTARFIFNNGTVADTVDSVGFRLRGNTSRYSQKKSFKVSFNTFSPGRKYYGVEKLNLNGEHNDPTIMRSKVCWDILRKMEIPAPRSNHVRVYINGSYYGLYINVEHIDEEFVKLRFGNNDGNLYKCLWPADLKYLGSDPENYKYEQNGRRAYALKTNEEADDYTDIANFIDVLNNSSAGDLVCNLDDVFNTYDYLKVIAADILFGNWDGYIYNKNNFYLYHNTANNKMEYIPYDLDNTLGIDWINRDWANRNIYDWQNHGDYRPLYERIIDNSILRNQYTFFMDQLINRTLDLDSLINSIELRKDMIASYVDDDPYYPLDYGYSFNDFNNSYTQSLGGHVDYGLFPYLQTRINSINNQLESTTMKPVIKYIRHNRTTSSEVWVRAYAAVDYAPANVKVVYTFEGQNPDDNVMYDDGQHYDGEAGDNIYGGQISGISQDSYVTYQIKVTDDIGSQTTMPCTPILIPASGGGQHILFINEFMASNESTIADEHGDYDDWIEIYNPEDVEVWLGDKSLTDDLVNPDKFQLPDMYIEPHGFLIIWCDNEPEQGPLHATFKLSKDGEDIGLFRSDETIIDELNYGPQTSDISFGRSIDGDLAWRLFEDPTPGSSNNYSWVSETQVGNSFVLYPNPVSGNIVNISDKISFKVVDMFGRVVSEKKNYDFINITGYTKGIYVVVSDNGNTQKLIIK